MNRFQQVTHGNLIQTNSKQTELEQTSLAATLFVKQTQMFTNHATVALAALRARMLDTGLRLPIIDNV